jgi:hypothetical protein
VSTSVITVASGGLAVTDVTVASPSRGLPVTEAIGTTKYGLAVTKIAAGGLPVTFVVVSTTGGYPK